MPVEANLGGASLMTFTGEYQLKNHPVCHTPLTKQNIGYLILILFSLIFTPVAPRSSCAWLIFGMEVSRPLLQLVMKKVIILLYHITYNILNHFIQPAHEARGPEGPAR